MQVLPNTAFLDKYNDSNYKNHPVIGVTHLQAKQYCKWLGLRLPNKFEWEVAARETKEQLWPWGDDPPSPVDAHMFLDDDLSGTVPVRMPKENQQPLYHMVGNVWEWVEWIDLECSGLSCRLLLHQKSNSIRNHFIAMGGSFDSNIGMINETYDLNSEVAEPDIGFRCAKFPN